MKAPFCFAVAAMLFASCSSDEPVAVLQADTPAPPYKVTPEEGANYKNDGKTYANTEDAVKWLNKHGGLRATDLEYYNENKILNALKKGEPVLARGYSHKTKAWILKKKI